MRFFVGDLVEACLLDRWWADLLLSSPPRDSDLRLLWSLEGVLCRPSFRILEEERFLLSFDLERERLLDLDLSALSIVGLLTYRS